MKIPFSSRPLPLVILLVHDWNIPRHTSLNMEASPHISPASQVPTTEDDPVQCKSFASVTLDAPSSCIEFSRVADGVFVVGTYNLVEAESEGGSQSRNGSLVLMHGDERGL